MHSNFVLYFIILNCLIYSFKKKCNCVSVILFTISVYNNNNNNLIHSGNVKIVTIKRKCL